MIGLPGRRVKCYALKIRIAHRDERTINRSQRAVSLPDFPPHPIHATIRGSSARGTKMSDTTDRPTHSVAGGGSAGCALASRLSENASLMIGERGVDLVQRRL